MRYLDLSSKEQAEELRQWCKFHWENTIKKSLDSFNPCTYHDCCFCFCRRAFSKKAGHPVLESASILKIPGLKTLTSADELFNWLWKRAELHARLGRNPIFPTINKHHHCLPDSEETDDEDKDEELLAKRCDELVREKETVLEELEKLQADNSKLQASSKCWFSKYQDAIRNFSDRTQTTSTDYLVTNDLGLLDI